MTICLMVWSGACLADARELTGFWYQAPGDWGYQGQADLAMTGLKPVTQVNLTGGHFWQQADFEIKIPGRYVIDFKNTSIIGYFRHIVLDAQRHPIADRQGGIESPAINPFFLRHGREIELAAGHYRLLTELNSPFFLAHPQPYLNTLDLYRQAIKPGNALTLLGLGLFLGLLCYYAAQSVARWNLSAAMYSLFILGNLLFNGSGLLMFSELFGMHWFYLVSLPILFSNIAYVLFVMALLEIRYDSHPRLYTVGLMILALLGGLMVLAAAMPNWSMEIDRYGVGLFLVYGLVAGIARSRDGSKSARLYLCAIGTFFVLGVMSISANGSSVSALYIEHLGLFSVAIEVLLLALVLSYQLAQLAHEKDDAVKRMNHSMYLAHTDNLTGLPNRAALEEALVNLPQQGSLTFIDMDSLKYYNDRFGHECGDALLSALARYLSEHLGGRARAYRLGGDEFAIICEHGDVAWVESRLALATADMRANGFESAGASCGSAHVHEARDSAKLKHMADVRMYQNKRLRKRSRHEDMEKQ
ncbi:MAG: diguanylate cyclase [Gammaproteobacteria bacterium HGW-Gammaproteobacteria-3]|nr:MAG: diguanylate cyclase [Gammaproteobacteria bacterium HGW-Gammaproteobacteria-3]